MVEVLLINMWEETRMFGNRNYRLHDMLHNQEDADLYVSKLKAKGFNARVVKGSNGDGVDRYGLYICRRK